MYIQMSKFNLFILKNKIQDTNIHSFENKIAKMTTFYHLYKVNLTEGQAESVAKAMKHKMPITLRLTYNNLMRGDETVNLTQSQINKLEKAKNKGVGANFKISRAQLRKLKQAEEA